jgi:hypothetical protein
VINGWHTPLLLKRIPIAHRTFAWRHTTAKRIVVRALIDPACHARSMPITPEVTPAMASPVPAIDKIVEAGGEPLLVPLQLRLVAAGTLVLLAIWGAVNHGLNTVDRSL